MEKIIDLYEAIGVYEAEINCKNKERINFKSPSSIHSEVTDWAYGKMIEKSCYDISDGNALIVKVFLETTDARFKLKLNATLFDWEKYTIDITVKVNGKTAVSQSDVLLENVNLGWPSVYFDIDTSYFTAGENVLEINTTNATQGGLLVSQVRILAFPPVGELEQVSVREYVKNGQNFAVAIVDGEKTFTETVDLENCEYQKATYFDELCVLSFKATRLGEMQATAVFNGQKIRLVMPESVENGDEFLIGTDSDDHRHDDSEELQRIMHTVIFSDMVNFVQFRPKYIRNFMTLAPQELFEKYVELMDLFGIKYGLVDGKQLMSFLVERHPENFYGYHVHEPYHFFNTGLEKLAHFGGKNSLFNFKGLRESESFGESKELFKEYLRKSKEKHTTNVGCTSVGSPSLLCVYEGEAGFDRITIEPVSNVNILLGAVRASSVSRWGAHIPTDWYFGVPVDEVKSNKYRLAMQFAYLNGASYVYAENSLFKTNAFKRLDFEDEHCVLNRRYLREFYKYTQKNPRKGKLLVEKAIVYGRNEFIMWQTNDRMGELKERDWDCPVWGKWDNAYQDCWQASDAWLPVCDKQNEVETPLNTKLFSGTPYGSVDVVYADNEFEKYKVIAFLGWNTMDKNLFNRLKTYVNNGGTLVISYCHLNTVDRNDLDPKFIADKEVNEFFGVTITGEFEPDTRVSFADETTFLVPKEKNVRSVLCEPTTAEIVLKDKFGNGVIYKNAYGKGQVYFVAFKEYFNQDWAIKSVKRLLENIGNGGDIVCDNKNVSFTVREQEDGKYVIDVLNMNCLPNATENFTLRFYGKTICDSVCVGEIKQYTVMV